MLEITVPATSANMGAGFDSLGLALGLYNRVWLEEDDRVRVETRDQTPVPLDRHNLVYKTAKYLFDVCGRPLEGLHIIQESKIPMARGLGSSSACIVAGLMGANRLMGEPLSRDAVIDMAAAMEGHPDNSTPAILGGQVTAAMENGKVYCCRQELRGDLRFAAIIPDFELKASVARAALPKEVPHKDAVFNLSRAALTAASLATGAYHNLRVSMDDCLHQPYRVGMIRGGAQTMRRCAEMGAWGVYISGAGPTIMAVIDAGSTRFAEEIGAWLAGEGFPGWRISCLAPDNTGTTVEEVQPAES